MFFNFWGEQGDRRWTNPPSKKDHIYTGIDLRALKENLQLLFVLNLDQLPVENMLNGGSQAKNSRYTLSGFYRWLQNGSVTKPGGFYFDGDLMYQFGSVGTSLGKAEVSAYVYCADLKYFLHSAANFWFGAGFDITTGDDGMDSGSITYFTAELYSKHVFQGHMDYFTSVTSKMNGLKDLIFRFGFMPYSLVKTSVDIHRFSYQKKFLSAVNGKEAGYLGTEIDITNDCPLR